MLISVSTETATLTLFDPTRLDGIFGRQLNGVSSQQLNEAVAKGKVALIETGADGTFGVEVIVNEPITTHLPVVRDPSTVEDFSVPSGQLCLTGAEALGSSDDRNPKNCFFVPKGFVRLTFYRTYYSPALRNSEFKNAVTAGQYRLHHFIHGWLAFACATLLFGIFGIFMMPLLQFVIWLAICSIPILIYFALRKIPSYREVAAQWTHLDTKLPSLILHVESGERRQQRIAYPTDSSAEGPEQGR
jgi:hypothetical protein